MMPVTDWRKTKLVKVVDAAWGDTSKTKSSYVEAGFTAFSASGPDGFLDYFDYDQEGIVLSAIGANCGKVYFASGKWSCIKNTMRFLVKDKEELSAKFLFYALSNPKAFVRRGSGQPFIRQQDVRDMEISYPPLPEQQKIVEILEGHLSRLDAGLADVKQAKLKAAQFRRSLLQAAFTGNLSGDGTRLMTEFPNGWHLSAIGDLCNPVEKVDPAKLRRDTFMYVDIGALEPSSSSLEHVVPISTKNAPGRARQLIRNGDSVFATVRPYMKKVAYISKEFDGEIASTGFCVLRPIEEKLHPKFLFYFLLSDQLLDQVLPLQRGVSYPAIRDNDLRSALLPLPSLPEQQWIVEILEDYLSRLDASVAIADALEKQFGSLRRSILQAAFTGQLTKEVASV